MQCVLGKAGAAKKRGEVTVPGQPLRIVLNGTEGHNGRTPDMAPEPAQETSTIVKAPEESIKR